MALGGGLAGADSFNPVRLAITIAPVARLAQPLAITVNVSADAGALDTATAPLRIRAKLADECGGTFDTTPGPVLIDAELNPQPATGQAYQATGRGAGDPTAYGQKTVCAFLEEEGDDRQFANDTVDPPMVDVSKPCTLAAGRYDAALQVARAREASAPPRQAPRQPSPAEEAGGEAEQDRRARPARRAQRLRPGRAAVRRRRLLLAVTAGVLALAVPALAGATSASTATAGATSASAAMPPIGHVFVIVLENESASTTFGAGSPAPYLSTTLRSEGAYLPNYYAVGHESNDNYIAMISGQAPTAQNQADCQFYDNLEPGTIGSYGQAEGTGCVYPADVPTIADQLTASGLTWRDYNESMGADPTREASECGHPGINSVDNTQKATATDEYATRHDPFVYFHSIIDDTALCDSHVVNLDLLPHDLASAVDTPNYVFITPDLCDDGHDSPCANGQPGGLAQADAFLRQWVPQITNSPAFTQQHGLLIITFDEADTSDTSSCCGEIPGPDSPEPGVNGPGGGDVGAVLLSPCIAPGTVSTVPYNHYSMLRSVEDIFGLPHLGYAQLPG